MNKNILDIKTIRKYIATRKIEWTKHCLKRLNQRNNNRYKNGHQQWKNHRILFR